MFFKAQKTQSKLNINLNNDKLLYFMWYCIMIYKCFMWIVWMFMVIWYSWLNLLCMNKNQFNSSKIEWLMMFECSGNSNESFSNYLMPVLIALFSCLHKVFVNISYFSCNNWCINWKVDNFYVLIFESIMFSSLVFLVCTFEFWHKNRNIWKISRYETHEAIWKNLG